MKTLPMQSYFAETSATIIEFEKQYTGQIEKMITVLTEAFKQHKTVFFCGNGGSAADAQHLAAEFLGYFKIKRKALSSISLHSNSSALTAIANDIGYDNIFARQLEGIGKSGDILVGISTSGNSENVIQAVKMAKIMGITSIGFLGNTGGKLKDLVDYPFIVPSAITSHIQETHITFGHYLCGKVEEQLFSSL